MHWEQTEFVLKGIYLGLLLVVALQAPTWLEVAQVALITSAGLVLCLGVAAVRKLREGYRIKDRLAGFILFLVLENPGLVYTGMILGLTLGTYNVFKERGEQRDWQLVAPVLGGAALGLGVYFLRYLRDRRLRLWLGLVLAAGLVGGAVALFHFQPHLFHEDQRAMLGYLLLLGLPGFYLLTLASVVEESEFEIAAACAALGVALWILGEKLSPNFGFVAMVVPLALYFVYTRRILPGLRVFKHVLRGISYAEVGRFRPALLSLGRAVALDPANPLAREQLWHVYRRMDFHQLVRDPETLAVVDFDMCLERVAALLLLQTPKPEQLQEAQRLLDLIAEQQPQLQPTCDYWRCVAFLHQRQSDQAARHLERLLAAEADSPARRAVLMPGWYLALLLHPEMIRRVGTPLIAHPARRLEAIAAVERRLAQGEDAAAWELKRLLYSDLTEADYRAAAPEPRSAFDYSYAQQLGLALLDDQQQWQRGCEYLRIAAHGLPSQAPAIFIQIAKAHEKAGDLQGMWHNYEQAKNAGRAVFANLGNDDRHALFAVVKLLGEHAVANEQLDIALDCFKFYTRYERAGLETYRTLADLFERTKDIWQALQCTEHGLTYDAQDKDLRERKDRYYYSVTADQVRQRREDIYKWFDVDYCLQKARWVLERKQIDLDLLDWAGHLAELAQALTPTGIIARVLRARVLRQRGEIVAAIALLEEVRQNRPEKFASNDEEEAWYLAHRLLGDMYLEEKPDQAALCFQEFKKSSRSGADTLFKLGKAYENLGDRTRAAKYYEQVTAFDGHPLRYDAQDALDRLRT